MSVIKNSVMERRPLKLLELLENLKFIDGRIMAF